MDVKALVQNLFPNKEHNILEKEEERNVRKVLSLCAVILMYMCLWITYASAEIAFVFDEAWDEEHETYTSENYGLQVMLSGLEDNTVYRAMLMGETLHGESFSIPAIVYPIGNGNAQINIWDLVTEPGVYENLVLRRDLSRYVFAKQCAIRIDKQQKERYNNVVIDNDVII